MTQLEDFRHMKDRFFAADPDTPLTPEQRRAFRGLRYFRDNPALRLEVTVEEFPQKDAIEMQTATGAGCATCVTAGSSFAWTGSRPN